MNAAPRSSSRFGFIALSVVSVLLLMLASSLAGILYAENSVRWVKNPYELTKSATSSNASKSRLNDVVLADGSAGAEGRASLAMKTKASTLAQDPVQASVVQSSVHPIKYFFFGTRTRIVVSVIIITIVSVILATVAVISGILWYKDTYPDPEPYIPPYIPPQPELDGLGLPKTDFDRELIERLGWRVMGIPYNTFCWMAFAGFWIVVTALTVFLVVKFDLRK